MLLLRKGTYPYEYMDNWDKFNNTMFPSINDCYSKLRLQQLLQ